jgi:hypothetical protein
MPTPAPLWVGQEGSAELLTLGAAAPSGANKSPTRHGDAGTAGWRSPASTLSPQASEGATGPVAATGPQI